MQDLKAGSELQFIYSYFILFRDVFFFFCSAVLEFSIRVLKLKRNSFIVFCLFQEIFHVILQCKIKRSGYVYSNKFKAMNRLVLFVDLSVPISYL